MRPTTYHRVFVYRCVTRAVCEQRALNASGRSTQKGCVSGVGAVCLPAPLPTRSHAHNSLAACCLLPGSTPTRHWQEVPWWQTRAAALRSTTRCVCPGPPGRRPHAASLSSHSILPRLCSAHSFPPCWHNAIWPQRRSSPSSRRPPSWFRRAPPCAWPTLTTLRAAATLSKSAYSRCRGTGTTSWQASPGAALHSTACLLGALPALSGGVLCSRKVCSVVHTAGWSRRASTAFHPASALHRRLPTQSPACPPRVPNPSLHCSGTIPGLCRPHSGPAPDGHHAAQPTAAQAATFTTTACAAAISAPPPTPSRKLHRSAIPATIAAAIASSP